MGKWKGVWKSDQTCLFYIIHICGATSQKAVHTDAASRPYTDQSGIFHENAIEKELSTELKKLKKVQKTCEVSPIAVFWLICVTDNRFYVE